jgi:hypothetical protein
MAIRRLAVVCVLALAVSAPSAAINMSISSSWRSTPLGRYDSLRRAEDATRRAGFEWEMSTVLESVFGERSAYASMIRCVPERGIVFFVVAGPRDYEANAGRQALEDSFMGY